MSAPAPAPTLVPAPAVIPTTTTPVVPATTPIIMGYNFNQAFNAATTFSSITRLERAALAPFDRERVRQKAIASLSPLFDTKGDLLKQDNQGNDFLTNSLDFQKQVKNLKSRLVMYSMEDAFLLYDIDPASGLPTSTTTTSLLDVYSTTSLETVLNNSKMHFGYGDKILNENLVWSKELILASSDPDLRTRIETQMATVEAHHDTGLIAFYYLATFVISTSDQVARAIVTKLSSMRLSHFPGEDVVVMAATVRGAAARLASCNRLPIDMNDIVIEILDSASSFKFRSEFDTLLTTGNPIMADWQLMLDRAVLLYHTLVLRKRWTKQQRSGASFASSGNQPPSDPGAFPAPTSKPLPTGRTLRTHDYHGNPIDRTPPPKGEATSRTHNTKTEHWCPHCDWGTGRWGNHPASGHDTFVTQRQALRKKPPTTPTGPSTGTPMPSTTPTTIGSPPVVATPVVAPAASPATPAVSTTSQPAHPF
jgi:hypothetical protein